MLNRQLLAYVYIPIIKRECDLFVDNWNSHRIRYQGNLLLPTNHIFSFPENYRGNHCGIPVTHDALEEVAEVSGLLEENPAIYIHDERIKHACEQCLPEPFKMKINAHLMVHQIYFDEPFKVDSVNAKEACLFLRENILNGIALSGQ